MRIMACRADHTEHDRSSDGMHHVHKSRASIAYRGGRPQRHQLAAACLGKTRWMVKGVRAPVPLALSAVFARLLSGSFQVAVASFC